MNKKASKRFTMIIFALTAAVILFAFIHSSMPDYISDEESQGVLDFIIGFFRLVGISAELSDHIVRKLAHFTEFTALGMLLTSCAYCFDRFKPYQFITQIMLSGLLTAVIDETIQLNVVGRSGQITDVLLDFSGVITGTVVMLVFYKIYIQLRMKKE